MVNSSKFPPSFPKPGKDMGKTPEELQWVHLSTALLQMGGSVKAAERRACLSTRPLHERVTLPTSAALTMQCRAPVRG